MKRVGVREFRDNATKYFAGDEAIVIERHGEQIGVFIPTAKRVTGETKRSGMARLDQAVDRFLQDTGMSEAELERWFDTSKPYPPTPDELRELRERATRS